MYGIRTGEDEMNDGCMECVDRREPRVTLDVFEFNRR